MRAVSSLLLSLLMVATLLCGGCVSCPRFFMFPGAQSDCCNKTGQCERPTNNAPKKECNRMPLELPGATHAHAELAVAAVAAAVHIVQPLAPIPFAATRDTVLFEHSPPDLNVLNATFLI